MTYVVDDPADVAARFWSKVRIGPNCWEWTASKTEYGYGRINVGGNIWKAPRVSWTLAYGAIPRNVNVCHHCDNPSCVRPSHLFLGTQMDNVSDAVRKGRMVAPRGEQNGSAVLTLGQVNWIRGLDRSKWSQRKIATFLGVGKGTIQSILEGKTWALISPGVKHGKAQDGLQ